MLIDLSALEDNSEKRDRLLRQKAEKYNTITPVARATTTSQYDAKLSLIRESNKVLEPHMAKFEVVKTIEELRALSKLINSAGIFALDTETTGLEPAKDEVVSIQVYTGKGKAYYIPIGHKSYVTNEYISGQFSKNQITGFLKSIQDCKIVTHNYTFDNNFLFFNFGVSFPAYFDTYIASRLLNENEKSASLKELYVKYVLKGRGEVLKFANATSKLIFDIIPIELSYPYGCFDAIMTWELYEFYNGWLDIDKTREDLKPIARVFWEIEMRLATAVSSMEQNGLKLDIEFNKSLAKSYGAEVASAEKALNESLRGYEKQIRYYQNSGELSAPINHTSTTQNAIIIYDILGEPLKEVKGELKKPTGKDYLPLIDLPYAEALGNYRKVEKLYRDFIKNLPNKTAKDGKIHTSFNQVGTDTLRFTSKSPNLQQIPSRDRFIRKMFVPSDGHIFVSGDYSKQEVVIIAYMAGDERLVESLSSGQDIYSVIASIAFQVSYEECVEFKEDGSTNYIGKQRRGQAKAIVLGILYGKGIYAISKDLEVTMELAQEIQDKILGAFPNLAIFIEQSQEMAYELGYVTTFFQTRRRLPDIKKAPLEITGLKGNKVTRQVYNRWARAYRQATAERGYETRQQRQEDVILSAKYQGIRIVDNKWLIAKLERKCCNARIQGSASYMMKLAIIAVYYDELMNQLGARLVLTIHDELILECPIENADKVAKRLEELMIQSAKDMMMEIKVDIAIEERWTGSLSEEDERELMK